MQEVRSSNPPVVTGISDSNEFVIYKLQIFCFAILPTWIFLCLCVDEVRFINYEHSVQTDNYEHSVQTDGLSPANK